MVSSLRRPNRLEPLVGSAIQREQRLEFQRHEPQPQQQQREQRESDGRGLEITETIKNAYMTEERIFSLLYETMVEARRNKRYGRDCSDFERNWAPLLVAVADLQYATPMSRLPAQVQRKIKTKHKVSLKVKTL